MNRYLLFLGGTFAPFFALGRVHTHHRPSFESKILRLNNVIVSVSGKTKLVLHVSKIHGTGCQPK